MALYHSEKIGGGTTNILWSSGKIVPSDWTNDASSNTSQKTYPFSKAERDAFRPKLARVPKGNLYVLVEMYLTNYPNDKPYKYLLPLWYDEETRILTATTPIDGATSFIFYYFNDPDNNGSTNLIIRLQGTSRSPFTSETWQAKIIEIC